MVASREGATASISFQPILAFIIRDNDDVFGADFDRVAKGAGARALRTAVRAPRMNSFCERLVVRETIVT